MSDIKKEILDMHDSNLSKLDVTKGEELSEIYVQNNKLTEIDLSNNKKIEKLNCTGNQLKYINAWAPGSKGTVPLELEAAKGGFVGLVIDDGIQQYQAVAEDGYAFAGWYDELGDRVFKDAIWDDSYGAGRRIIAAFRKKL